MALISKNTKLKTKLVINSYFDLKDIINERSKKSDILNLTDIKLAQNMQGLSDLFNSNESKVINITGWNTENIAEFHRMFKNCKNLKEIIGLETWNVSNVERFESMFEFCVELEKINISSWDISNANNISFLFNHCKNLKTLGAKEITLNCKNVKDFDYCFQNCFSLQGLIHLDNVKRNSSSEELEYYSKNMPGLLDIQYI